MSAATDSPRWCGICGKHGDHHTDRHAEMSDIHHHDCACSPDDRCTYCGCCQHCSNTCTCKVHDAPRGMPCPRSDCGCEGRS